MDDQLYYRAIQGLVGNKNMKDVKVAEIRNRFADDFDSSINVVYDALRNEVQQDFLIVPVNGKNDDNKCFIYARPGEDLYIGDIITWNKLHWLVTDINYEDDIYAPATITRCNRQIVWQNKRGEIIERWCVAVNSQNSKMNKGFIVSTTNEYYSVQVTYDDETIDVPVGKRFMYDIVGGNPMVYALEASDVNNDRYAGVDGGCITWTMGSSEYNAEVDSIELMVCDYIKPNPSNGIGLGSKITGKNKIKCGYSNTYIPTFYGETGEEIEVNSHWTVELSNPRDERYIHYQTDTQGRLIVSCDFVESVINHEITLTLCDENGLYEPCTMKIQVVSVYD